MGGLSGGQKVKIVLGAVLMSCFDDLVFLLHYLDCESLTALIETLTGFEGGIRRHLRPRRSPSRLVSTRGDDVTDDEHESVLLFSFSVPRVTKETLVYPLHTSCLPYRSSPESPSKTIIRPFPIPRVAVHRLRYLTLKVVERQVQ
ncbi:hypothetical protein BYT27DRAFT_6433436 [Phlegmacium glaucopus]|nr:hypothetical protein BYT27DRAFT_6433436 [Phlegmacium glaucopus]